MRASDDGDEPVVANKVTASKLDAVVQAQKISGDVNITYGASEEVVIASYSQMRSEIALHKDEIIALHEQRLVDIRTYADDLKRRLCWTEEQLAVALAALVDFSRGVTTGRRPELPLLTALGPVQAERIHARSEEGWDRSKHRVLEWHQEGEVFENGDAEIVIRNVVAAVGGDLTFYAQWRGARSSGPAVDLDPVEVYIGGVWVDGEPVEHICYRVHVGQVVAIVLEFPDPIPHDTVFVLKVRYVWPGRDQILISGGEEAYSVTLGGDGVNYSYKLKLPHGRNWVWRPLKSEPEDRDFNVRIGWEGIDESLIHMRGRAWGAPRSIGFWLRYLDCEESKYGQVGADLDL